MNLWIQNNNPTVKSLTELIPVLVNLKSVF